MKQLLQSEFTKNGTTFENVASPVGADQVKDIKVANGNLAYSTDGTNYTEVQASGGAELPEIESVKFSSKWYVTDKLPYPSEDIDINNMVMLDNKLYYFNGTDHYVYENGEWQPYVRGTLFDDNSIYGKDLFIMNGLPYLVFTDTNNDVGNYIYKAPYFYVVQYNSANIPSDGTKVWSRNGHYYYSDSTTQWEFDPTSNEWNTRTWGNVTDFDGDNIWTDGFEYYYSDGIVNYVLDGTNWVQKTWNYDVEGKDVWTDGKDIYYSNNGTNKKLVDGAWENFAWEYITNFIDEGYYTYNSNAYGRAILQWGNGIYAHVNRIDLSDENNPETITYFITNKSQGTFETSIDTLKVGDLNKQNNEEAFTVENINNAVGNINNALEILNNGNIGGGGVLISKTITNNGVYNAIDDGATGYDSVDVQVTSGNYGSLYADQNQTYYPVYYGVDAFNEVVVDVQGGGGNYGPITVDQNQTTYYPADYGVDAFSEVTVDVQIPASSGGTFTKSVQPNLSDTPTSWTAVLWTMPTSGTPSFNGSYVWTDGTDIYLNDASLSCVLDRATKTWTTFTFTNAPAGLKGDGIWSDGTRIFFTDNTGGSYILNVATHTWSTHTFTNMPTVNDSGLFFNIDGKTYCAVGTGTNTYVLDTTTDTWSDTGWVAGYGYNVWTDGANVYSKNQSGFIKYNRATDSWEQQTWNIINLNGYQVWTDGNNIYYSNTNTQMKLNKTTNEWENYTWTGATNVRGSNVWTDGDDIYYSYQTSQYKLDKKKYLSVRKTY